MLRKLLVLGGIGYAGFRVFLGARARRHAAFADGQPQGSHTDVRDAGPAAMRDAPVREWTRIDEAGDESFPASDPPGGY